MFKNNKFYIEKLQHIVFLGESKILDQLENINLKYNLSSHVVTSQDQAKSIKKNKKIIITKKIDNNFKKKITSLVDIRNTLFISLGARWIFKKQDIFDFFKNNIVNFHSTRLPFDKGGANISWKIINGDKIDNQLVHVVDDTIDGGAILLNKKSIIPNNCKTPHDYMEYHNKQFLYLYEEFIKRLNKEDKFLLYRQPDYIGNYNPRLNSEISSWIDWSMSSSHLTRFIDAFDEPYTGAKTFINDKQVYLKNVHLHGGDFSSHPFKKGIVARHDKKWLTVCTSDSGTILIEKILNKNKKNIIDSIKEGDRFYTPNKFLDISLSKRIKYNSVGHKFDKS